MDNKIKLSRLIEYIIIVLAIAVFIGVWPTSLIHRTHVARSSEIAVSESLPVGWENRVTQLFYSEGTKLDSIDLYVCNDMAGETLSLRLYDYEIKEIYHLDYEIPENVQTPGLVRVPVRFSVTRGMPYYIGLDGVSKDAVFGLEDHSTTTSVSVGTILYSGVEDTEHNLVIRYNYQIAFNVWQTIVIALMLAIMSAVAIIVMRKVVFTRVSDKELNVIKVKRVIFTPLVVLISGAFLVLTVGYKAFGDRLVSILFYSIGIIILAVYLVYVLWAKRDVYKSSTFDVFKKENIKHTLQAICFAGAIWHCSMYWNGMYDIFHYYSTRRMLIWFLLAILVSFDFKQLFSIVNGIVLVVSATFGYFYAKPYVGTGENELLYKLSAGVIVVGALVLSNLVMTTVKAVKTKSYVLPDKIHSIATILLLIGLIVFNNTKTWVILAAVMLLILTVRLIGWDERGRLSETLCNAVIYNFIWTVGYCLLHRPYQAYQFYRYGMQFHTVTVTAEYLTLVVAAAFVRFLVRYRTETRAGEKHLVAAMWKEMLFLTTALVYVILTLSRTGILATGMVGIIILGVFIVQNYEMKERLSQVVRIVLMIALGTICIFFSVFTYTRICPSLVYDPIYSDNEAIDEAVKQGTPSDSDKYMTPRRFGYVAGVKVLGMSEEPDVRNAANDRIKDAINSVIGNWGMRMEFGDDGIIRILDDDDLEILIASKDGALPDSYVDMIVAPKSVGIDPDMLLLSEEDGNSGLEGMGNGRITIFKAYIDVWNLTGHEDEQAMLPNGDMAVHAHNSFLQAIHDFGTIVGFYVIIFGMWTFVYGVIVAKKEIETSPYRLLTPAIIVGFTVAGMTEWMFHICNPMGWALFMCVVPLLFSTSEKENV